MISDLVVSSTTPAAWLLATDWLFAAGWLVAQEQAAPGPGGADSTIGAILNNPMFLLVGLFLLFYFIVILPERRRKADEAKMMSAMKKNDRIVTIGGIHGTIVSAPTDTDVVTIKIDEAGNTRVKINRSAIARIVQDGNSKGKDSDSGSND